MASDETEAAYAAIEQVSAILYGLELATAQARTTVMRHGALTLFAHRDLVGRVERLRSAVQACKVDDASSVLPEIQPGQRG